MTNIPTPPHLSMRLLNETLALERTFAAAPWPLDAPPVAGLVDSIAVIPVCGVLVHGTGDPDCGLLGYDTIAECFDEAVEEDSVAAIVLLIDSPGGHVAGLFSLADAIFAAREVKPIVAVVDGDAYSAAYCIAAAAHYVTVPETGGVGSIGCARIHADVSEMLKMCGVTATIIRSAPRKMEGNPIEPLSDDARQRMQDDVDAVADMFIGRVALFRQGKITDAQIRAIDGGLCMGAAGVQAGLADQVLSPGDAVASLCDALFGQA